MNDNQLRGSSSLLQWKEISPSGIPSKKQVLFVWVPAFVGNKKTEGIIEKLVNARCPHAHAIFFRYRGGLSNIDPYEIAAELQHVIADVYKTKSGQPYDEVILMGYSAGALLLRKAMVFGSAKLEDHPFIERGRESLPIWSEILKRTRTILIAGTNRGWSLEKRPRHMPKLKYLIHRVATALFRPLPLGGLIYALERGQPFIANLRVQWIRMAHEFGDAMPPVIQLLGSHDDVVAKEDNKDILVSSKFIFVPVPDSGHDGIVNVNDPRYGEPRYDAIAAALTENVAILAAKYQAETEDLRLQEVGTPEQATGGSQDEPPIVVFLMHGIRDNSDWPRELQEVIEQKAGNRRVRCVPSSYGHFSMSAFLLLNMRRKNVRWFMDRYTEELARILPHAKSPDDVEMNFVGHSNGTYLLARGLQTYAAMKFDRVAFMGSVVPSSFPWRTFYRDHRLTAFRNDRSANDWIVGCFPGFYQLVGAILPFQFFTELGNGGFRGFDQLASDNHTENFYFQGGHGEPTKKHNYDSLADFVLGGSGKVSKSSLGDESGLCVYLSRLCWLVWIALGVSIVGIGYLISISVPAGWISIAVVAYAILLLLLLATI